MFYLGAGALVNELGDPLAVAVPVIALVAKETQPRARAGQRAELVKLFTRLPRREVLLIDVEQPGEIATAGGDAALLGRAAAAKVQVPYSAPVKPRGRSSL